MPFNFYLLGFRSRCHNNFEYTIIYSLYKCFEQLNFRHIDVPYNQINEIDTIIDRFINFKNKAIYIEPRFNNPTGRSLTNEQKKNIITYSERHNIPIIEDDIFRDIFFSDPTPSIKTYDKLGKVIHISSFSKRLHQQ